VIQESMSLKYGPASATTTSRFRNEIQGGADVCESVEVGLGTLVGRRDRARLVYGIRIYLDMGWG